MYPDPNVDGGYLHAKFFGDKESQAHMRSSWCYVHSETIALSALMRRSCKKQRKALCELCDLTSIKN